MLYLVQTHKEDSIKAIERKMRGCGEKLVVRGESMKKPDSWKCFLANDDNKRQLVKVMLDEWSNDSIATKLHDREVIFICEGFAYSLKSDSGETTETTEGQELYSTQEETDTRIVVYCMYARDHGYKNVPSQELGYRYLLHLASLRTCY